KVSKIGSKAIDVETPAGVFKIPVKGTTGAKAGDDLSFSVSADFMQLHTKKPTSKSTSNALPVTLISEEFIGSVVTLFLEGPNGTEFKCQVQERELGDLDMKSEAKLYLSWPVESGHVLEEQV
ncbi:MAG: TOBE domain-containing protein, partial [Pseudomonadota bacterium]